MATFQKGTQRNGNGAMEDQPEPQHLAWHIPLLLLFQTLIGFLLYFIYYCKLHPLKLTPCYY